jgi:hypothetical protein
MQLSLVMVERLNQVLLKVQQETMEQIPRLPVLLLQAVVEVDLQIMDVTEVLAEALVLQVVVVVVIHLCVHLMEMELLAKVMMVEKLTTAAVDLVVTNLAAAAVEPVL